MHTAAELAGFIDDSPTQFHAVQNAAIRLAEAGFEPFVASEATGPGARFIVRDGALVAWFDGDSPASPMRIIGAHTDSPNLRIRPRPDTVSAGLRQLGVEVYGGALLNSWLDRDLGIAGRVTIDDGSGGVATRLFRSAEPQLRVAQLAIHLDRGLNDSGLKLDRQRHMTPIWSVDAGRGDFEEWLAELVGVSQGEILGWDAACFDFQPSAVIGRGSEFLAAPRLDNLCSSYGAVEALISARSSATRPGVIALFDHEEVGSTSATGADSVWLSRVLEQRRLALGIDPNAWLTALSDSLLLSADMAHATHPNYVERHEPNHHVALGGGPVIKHNVNVRYATDSVGAAEFRIACERADVAVQEYSHRGDLPCGSTIGPLASSQLSVRTVDVGMAQLSMHSAREMMATSDIDPMVRSFTEWLLPPER